MHVHHLLMVGYVQSPTCKWQYCHYQGCNHDRANYLQTIEKNRDLICERTFMDRPASDSLCVYLTVKFLRVCITCWSKHKSDSLLLKFKLEVHGLPQ